MARAFSSASSQYLERSGDPLGSVPFTFSLWFNPDNATTNHPLITLESTSYYDWACLLADGASPGDPLTVNVASGSVASIATQNGFTASSWNHAAGTFDSVFGTYIGSKYSFLNGTKGAVGSATTSYMRTPIVLRIGRHVNYGYASCKIAEVGIWNVILTDSEIAALAKGYTPQQIRPKSLIAYYPLGGRYGQYDLDRWKNKYDLTAVNSPTWADHGRVIYPRRRVWNVAWTGPATFTATISASHAGMSAAVSASHTRPTYTASVAATSGGMSAAVSASHTTPTYTATVAATAGAMTASASAAHVRPTYTASVAASHGAMSCVASAAHATPTYTASVSAAVAGMTAAVTASHVAPTYTASVAASCGAMVASATATAAAPVFAAVVSASHGAMTASASATRTAPTYGATVSVTFAGMVAAAISAVPDVDYSVTAATEAVARRLGTEARSRSVRIEAVARRAATESLCRVGRTEALARRLGTEAR